MKILLWHGYLLTGSGSNVYTANLARAWREAGHEVLVLCQERNAKDLSFVDAEGGFIGDNSALEVTPTGTDKAPGACLVVRPDIGGLLPVFVYDEYEGFAVKLFPDLTDEELTDYTERNVAALRLAIETFQPDVLVTGHEVMGPAIALRACSESGLPYTAKLHGSGLEYAVKLQDRYRAHAAEGLGGAAKVIGGSRYMLEAASKIVGGWEERGTVVNPGCDVEVFAPVERPEPPVPTVGYVGKLIIAKGVHNLIASLGFTKIGPLKSTIVGYGAQEEEFRALAAALTSGDTDRARSLVEAPDPSFDDVRRVLASPPPGFIERMGEIEIDFTGRLEHDPLARLLPTFDVLVVPSIVPEAFGMVAAEAAASGVLPIVPDHSGVAEAGQAVEEAIGAPGLLTYDPSDPLRGIAAALDRVLSIPFEERVAMGLQAAELARERWAWGHVAERLLAIASEA
jgi:glycosyltransferase involved in cell wall biosynthesis